MEVAMRTHLFLITILFLAILTSTIQAVTIYVPDDFSTIQAGIEACTDGDTVIVRDGTYTGDGNREIDFLGKAILVMSENGAINYVIDCEDSGRGFYFQSGEDQNSVLHGFTVINGGGGAGFWNGGGIYCYNSSPIITGNTISGNNAQWGGGIYFSLGSPSITGNIISGNRAGGSGGISFDDSSPIIIGNTITGNEAFNIEGGGIAFHGGSPTIMNSILWGNSPDEIYVYNANPIVTYSDIEGGWPGEGNIDINPLFRDPEAGDYHLTMIGCYDDSTDSPCIDAGCPDSSDVILDCDYGLGTDRCDMGAYGGRAGTPVSIREPYKPELTPLPKTFSLSQNYPNPFNPTTTITFDVPGTQCEAQYVQLTVYNLRGKQVIGLIDSDYEPGSHRVVWNGKNERGEQVTSGIYLYTLRSGDKSYTKKMVMLK
jgi:hypothetical protein